jgi:hypothetical protein
MQRAASGWMESNRWRKESINFWRAEVGIKEGILQIDFPIQNQEINSHEELEPK